MCAASVRISILSTGCHAKFSVIAHRCTESALRVLLNLTQDETRWCQSLIANEMIIPFLMRTIMQSHKHRSLSSRATIVLGEENEDDAQILDRMCLALGVLTNLVQALSTAKNILRKTCTSTVMIYVAMLMYDIQCSMTIALANVPASIPVDAPTVSAPLIALHRSTSSWGKENQILVPTSYEGIWLSYSDC